MGKGKFATQDSDDSENELISDDYRKYKTFHLSRLGMLPNGASHKPKENEAKAVEVNKRDLDNGSFELSDDDDIFMLSRSQSKRSKKSKKKKSRIDEDVAELLYTPKISSSARSIVEAKKFQTFQTCEKEVFEVDPFEFDHSIFAQPLENNLSGDSIASTSVTVERCAIRIENLLDEKHSVILHLRMDATIRELATEYGKRFNMPIERMLLMDKEGRRCTLEKTPKSLGFKLDLLNVLELLETPSSSELADVISIKWQMNGKKPIITKANIKTPFSVLKEKLCKDNNIPSEVRLIFDSMAIRDDETPESLEMEHGDCIDIYQN